MANPLKSSTRPNVAVFASGNGSNFEAIARANLPINLALVVSDKPQAKVIERAHHHQIKTFVLELKNCLDKTDYETQILNQLKQHNIDFILLAGYMKIIHPTLLEAYPQKIINIHPAYLPHFPGKDGIGDAFKAGVSETGVTIHYVDEGVDTGQIIAQQKVPRYQTDQLEDLANRIHKVEHQLYPETIRNLIEKGEL
ncbi:phosphoribosylglycinamide formyltransferase [Holzapfeliella sp. He02]|uniref:Phosphoribosylglycinamide formyltransferase n=1 Tax=Holzapfeliella saturejae TaxID=3082953 RepID=A0ABU8SIV1_9LACO